MKSARVTEIFSSVQGEGPWIGERHIFVRLADCDIRCRYCDTESQPAYSPEGVELCRVQVSVRSLEYEQVQNPLSGDHLTRFCSRLIAPGPSRPVISLTGGEPLLHADFLKEWLPEVRKRFRIYLETNGLRYSDLEELGSMIDVISMDFKLPSATGLKPFWDEHRKFLAAGRGIMTFVKAVVTKDTLRDDLVTSARIIAEHDISVPLILQPASGPLAPDPALLLSFQIDAMGIINNVRIIPQAHKILSLP